MNRKIKAYFNFVAISLVCSIICSAQDVNFGAVPVPLFDGDSLKIYSFKSLELVNENEIVDEIEHFLDSLEYGVISSFMPIRTTELEVRKVKDTVGWWIFKSVINHPVVVKHQISLRSISRDRKAIYLKSYALVRPELKDKDSVKILKGGEKYLKKEFKDELKSIIKELIKD